MAQSYHIERISKKDIRKIEILKRIKARRNNKGIRAAFSISAFQFDLNWFIFLLLNYLLIKHVEKNASKTKQAFDAFRFLYYRKNLFSFFNLFTLAL